jgi:hypothetical protein
MTFAHRVIVTIFIFGLFFLGVGLGIAGLREASLLLAGM